MPRVEATSNFALRVLSIVFAAVLASSILHAAEAPLRVITLGDSITLGARPGVTAEETFAARLETSLRKKKLSAEVVNVGIGGERADQALTRLDEAVIAQEPHVVTVMYGTNDSYVDPGRNESRISEEAFRANLRRIVVRLREHKIEVVLMTEPRWAASAAADGLGQHPNLQLVRYVEITRQVARETETPLIDHFAHWSTAESQGADLADWTTDKLHPNPRGHQIMAKTMLPVVLKVIQQMRASSVPPR